jgi:ABC-2 type transport system permease protein
VKKIFAIFLKDTILRFTSPIEWGFFLILPIIFTFILGGGTGQSQDQRIFFYVVDQANSPLSSSLLSELEKSTAVRPGLVSLEEAEKDFDDSQISAVLIIPANFTLENLQSGSAEVELRQQPNNVRAFAIQQGVSAALTRISSAVDIAAASVSQAEALRPFPSEVEREVYFMASLDDAYTQLEAAPQRISEKQANTEDQVEYDPNANSAAGQMITWVFIPLIGLSAMFAMERQLGTLRRILVTPTSKATFLAGTVLGQVLTAVIQMAILIAFGALVLKLKWANAPSATALVVICSALAAGALGTMLGTFVKTEAQGNGLSIMIGMVMAMLGGCWYPIELFPQVMRSAAQALPTYWSMQGMLDILVRDQGVEGILLESGVLLGFALVFFLIGVLRFRYE